MSSHPHLWFLQTQNSAWQGFAKVKISYKINKHKKAFRHKVTKGLDIAK